MIIADGGSEEDIQSGYACSGSIERTFRKFSQENNLNYDEFYKTALIKERINLKNTKENIPLLTADYENILVNEIKVIDPAILVPLGELSFNFLTNLDGIRKFRGSVLNVRLDLINKPIRVIPILGPHPYLNEAYELHFISRLDVGKIAKNINKVGIVEEIGITWVCKDAQSLRNYIDRQYLKSPFLVFDIETYCGIPTCISLCFDGRESVTVPLLDRSIDLDNRVLMAQSVARLLASEIPKVNQNIKFDWKKLERFGFLVNNIIGDTQLGASTLYCEFPKNLGFLTSLYTDMPYFKDEGKEFDPTIHDRDRLYIYCAKDSLATHQIRTEQSVEMKELGVEGVYNKLIEILPLYKKMEENGIRIDNEQREKLLSKYESKFDIQLYKLHNLTNTQINPLSPKQVNKLVFDDLDYKIDGQFSRLLKKTKAGDYKTEEENLELLMWLGKARYGDASEILKSLIACRKLHKVLEYLLSPIHPDGRARCEFNLGGAETGRTTSGSTTDNMLVFKKGKINKVNVGRSFQNIGKHGFSVEGEDCGKDLRSMFIPSRGYSFVECDLSGAEARVDCVLANDIGMLQVFDGPIGIHRLTGSWIYECPAEEIKKGTLVSGEDRYYEAKTVRHAGERNMREDRLMLMIQQPWKRCQEILKIFHTKQPNIREIFHREIREAVQKSRLLVAPNGRRRDFYGRFDNHQINEGISFLPQAIVTDYLKNGLWKTFQECPWARPLNEQHDGLLTEVLSGREIEYGGVFKRNTEVEIDFRKCTLSRDYNLVIPVEVETSESNWSEMKGLKI